MWIGRLCGWRKKATGISNIKNHHWMWKLLVSQWSFCIQIIAAFKRYNEEAHRGLNIYYLVLTVCDPSHWVTYLVFLGLSLVACCSLHNLLIGGLIWVLCCFSPSISLSCTAEHSSAWCWCLRNWGFSSSPSPQPLGCPWLFAALPSCVSFSGKFALLQKACTGEWDWQSKITFCWWHLRQKWFALCVL